MILCFKFQPVITQNYCMTSKYFEYSAKDLLLVYFIYVFMYNLTFYILYLGFNISKSWFIQYALLFSCIVQFVFLMYTII